MTSRLPHLTCCPDGARIVALRYDPIQVFYTEHATRDAFLAAARENPPRWSISVLDDHSQIRRDVAIAVCPFCAEAVPDVRLRARPPQRFCVVTDGGLYCDTCERRLDDCRCAPTECLWEAARQ